MQGVRGAGEELVQYHSIIFGSHVQCPCCFGVAECVVVRNCSLHVSQRSRMFEQERKRAHVTYVICST